MKMDVKWRMLSRKSAQKQWDICIYILNHMFNIVHFRNVLYQLLQQLSTISAFAMVGAPFDYSFRL